MNVWEIILGILMIIVSLAIIGVVLLQQGHRAGINGAVSGGADTFLSRGKAKAVDAILAKWTKFIAIGFMALIIAANVVSIYL